jgi:dihydrolipoamide dehydrogenase
MEEFAAQIGGIRMAVDCDIAIIGAGPGGYVAAIRAAQKGATVALVEREHVGGVCLNWGCIPTKTLLSSAERLMQVRKADQLGITVGEVGFDYAAVVANKDRVVTQQRQGTETLLKSNQVQLIRGEATITGPRMISVKSNDGQTVEINAAKGIIVGTGSSESRPPVPGMDLPGVIGSTGALELTSLPKSAVVVGGGAVGVEFATIFNQFGVQTTIVEMLDRLLPLEDKEVSQRLAQSFKRQGIDVRVSTPLKNVESAGGGLRVTVGANGEETIDTELVLIGAGRRPNVEGIGLEQIGVAMDRRGIVVDDQMQTNVPGIFAIGDVTGKMALAHVASAQGEVAVDVILGGEAVMDYGAVPSVTFCHPQVASVGMTEDAARQAGHNVKVGKFSFGANGRSIASGETEGFVKVVADDRYGRILGVHIMHDRATDLIQEAVVAIKLESAVEDLVAAIHPHPTFSEAIMEAALDTEARAIHFYRRPR